MEFCSAYIDTFKISNFLFVDHMDQLELDVKSA